MHTANAHRECTRIDPPTQSDSTELAEVLLRDRQRRTNESAFAKRLDWARRMSWAQPNGSQRTV